jgi:hypothetical protein
MLRNPGIESVLRHELDSFPLPPEAEWFPRDHGEKWSRAAWLISGTLLIVIALAAGRSLSDWRESRGEGAAARPTPLVLPTVVGGQRVSPLPNIWRDPALGYNIVLPANWRESARSRMVLGEPDRSLIGRATYTAHTPQRELELIYRYGFLAKVPWDVTAELWSTELPSAVDWARTRGGCVATCTIGNTRINGTDFVTAIDSRTGMHAFYVLREDRLLAFSYIVGGPTEQPDGVTSNALEQIVRSVGLP